MTAEDIRYGRKGGHRVPTNKETAYRCAHGPCGQPCFPRFLYCSDACSEASRALQRSSA